MAELNGGTTIAGYQAIHSGLKEVYLSGNVSIGGNINLQNEGQIWTKTSDGTNIKTFHRGGDNNVYINDGNSGEIRLRTNTRFYGDIIMSAGTEIFSGYNNDYFIKDHNNGHITIGAAGGSLYLGYNNSQNIKLWNTLVTNDSSGNKNIATADGKLYYQGNDIEARYLNKAGDTMTGNFTMGAAYSFRFSHPTGTTGMIDSMNSTGREVIEIRSGGTSLSSGAAINLYGSKDSSFPNRLALYSGGGSVVDVNPTGVDITGALNISSSGNPSIELRSSGGGSPFIDFSNDSSIDYDARFILNGNDQIRLEGASFYISGNLDMGNSTIAGVTYLEGQYGRIARSTDEWLRFNDDNSHTSGVYFNQSVVRTDNALQVGSNGQYFSASQAGLVGYSTAAMTLKLVGNDTYQNYIGLFSGDGTTRNAWIGMGNTNNQDFSIEATKGHIILNPRNGANLGKVIIQNTYNIELGQTQYYNGTQAGGDAIYGVNMLHLGSGATTTVWGKDEVKIRTGAIGSNSDRMYFKNNGDTMIDGQYAKTFWSNTTVNNSTYKTISTTGWYRIATNAGNRAFGKFTLMDKSNGRHHILQFLAATAFNRVETASINILMNTKFSSVQIFGGVRLVLGSTYDTQYLDVWISEGSVVKMNVEENTWWEDGWTPVDFVGPQGIPTGYTAIKAEMQDGYLNRQQNVFTGSSAPPSEGAFPGDVYIQY